MDNIRKASLNKKLELSKLNPFPKQSTDKFSFSPLPISWLISSILFYFISSVVAPLFWPQLNVVDKSTEPSILNIVLGISGILIWLLEPFIYHNNIYRSEVVKSDTPGEHSEKKGMSLFSLIASTIVMTVVAIFAAGPYVAILIFKPVFRAIVLWVSLSFLNIGDGNTAAHPLFFIPVVADVFLYYIGMIAPKWTLNPVNRIINFITFKKRDLSRIAGSLLLIIHTALIYALLQNVVYYDFNKHPGKLDLKMLAWWWLFLTIYTRMSFLTDDFDLFEIIRTTPRRVIIITVIGLVISFISFIWPFYFA
jgi:hypothetical protein